MAKISERLVRGEGRVVNVAVPTDVLYNLDKMTAVQKTVLGKLGCPNCHSGFDIRFRQILDFVVDNKLNVKELAVDVES